MQYYLQAHPGTEVHNMNLYPDYKSLERLWTQVKGFRAEIERLINNRTEEVHLLGKCLYELVCSLSYTKSVNRSICLVILSDCVCSVSGFGTGFARFQS